jgi:hypothetical protein
VVTAKKTPIIKPATASPVAVVPAPKPMAKPPAKPTTKSAAKKTKPVGQPSSKPSVKTSAKPPAKTVAKPKAIKPVKAKKPKLVRDSFTIPKAEYTVLDELKGRAGKLASPAKKSELLRAGIKALAAMSDVALLSALKAVPAIKTGRPTKS